MIRFPIRFSACALTAMLLSLPTSCNQHSVVRLHELFSLQLSTGTPTGSISWIIVHDNHELEFQTLGRDKYRVLLRQAEYASLRSQITSQSLRKEIPILKKQGYRGPWDGMRQINLATSAFDVDFLADEISLSGLPPNVKALLVTIDTICRKRLPGAYMIDLFPKESQQANCTIMVSF
jgi:hypothetical protein